MSVYLRSGAVVRSGAAVATSENCCCEDVECCDFPNQFKVKIDVSWHLVVDDTRIYGGPFGPHCALHFDESGSDTRTVCVDPSLWGELFTFPYSCPDTPGPCQRADILPDKDQLLGGSNVQVNGGVDFGPIVFGNISWFLNCRRQDPSDCSYSDEDEDCGAEDSSFKFESLADVNHPEGSYEFSDSHSETNYSWEATVNITITVVARCRPCCLPGGSCVLLSDSACAAAGGTSWGEALVSTCDDYDPPCCQGIRATLRVTGNVCRQLDSGTHCSTSVDTGVLTFEISSGPTGGDFCCPMELQGVFGLDLTDNGDGSYHALLHKAVEVTGTSCNGTYTGTVEDLGNISCNSLPSGGSYSETLCYGGCICCSADCGCDTDCDCGCPSSGDPESSANCAELGPGYVCVTYTNLTYTLTFTYF